MTIEYRQRPDANGSADVVATACPYCEADLDSQQSLAKHLRYKCEVRP